MHTRLMNGETLSFEEARAYMGQVMAGEVSPVRLGAALAALRVRGETVDEIAGFMLAMRENAVMLPVSPGPLLDIVGTGGDGAQTFNVSTTSAFVLAAGGVRVAKHGNRAVSSRSGSADVLEALGVNLDAAPETIGAAVDELGIGFMFARAFHPAMRHASPVRAELAARTVFNVLGPLTNPARASHMVLGVYAPQLTRPLAEALAQVGVQGALVVHGAGLDELTVSGESVYSQLRGGEIDNCTLTPEQAGVGRHDAAGLVGGTAGDNAAITRSILQGGGTPAQRDMVALNAGAGFYIAGQAASIAAGVERAHAVLAGAEGWTLLERYAAYTRGQAVQAG